MATHLDFVSKACTCWKTIEKWQRHNHRTHDYFAFCYSHHIRPQQSCQNCVVWLAIYVWKKRKKKTFSCRWHSAGVVMCCDADHCAWPFAICTWYSRNIQSQQQIVFLCVAIRHRKATKSERPSLIASLDLTSLIGDLYGICADAECIPSTAK